MIIVIFSLTSLSVLVLLIGFLNIQIPVKSSTAAAIIKDSPIRPSLKINYKEQKKLEKRNSLYEEAHAGFVDSI